MFVPSAMLMNKSFAVAGSAGEELSGPRAGTKRLKEVLLHAKSSLKTDKVAATSAQEVMKNDEATETHADNRTPSVEVAVPVPEVVSGNSQSMFDREGPPAVVDFTPVEQEQQQQQENNKTKDDDDNDDNGDDEKSSIILTENQRRAIANMNAILESLRIPTTRDQQQQTSSAAELAQVHNNNFASPTISPREKTRRLSAHRQNPAALFQPQHLDPTTVVIFNDEHATELPRPNNSRQKQQRKQPRRREDDADDDYPPVEQRFVERYPPPRSDAPIIAILEGRRHGHNSINNNQHRVPITEETMDHVSTLHRVRSTNSDDFDVIDFNKKRQRTNVERGRDFSYHTSQPYQRFDKSQTQFENDDDDTAGRILPPATTMSQTNERTSTYDTDAHSVASFVPQLHHRVIENTGKNSRFDTTQSNNVEVYFAPVRNADGSRKDQVTVRREAKQKRRNAQQE